jgi:protein-disulfide isomerase
MSFISKDFSNKPSLLKPIILVVVILLIVGAAYSFFGNKKSTTEEASSANNPAEAPKIEIVSSGIAKDTKVETVEDVEKVMEKWVEANPKAILASVANMQRKMMEDQAKEAQKNIGPKKDQLFNDKTSAQYAPKGYDVTIVEFFDYACGYCKKAQSTVEELVKEDKKVRVIYKEFPILGQPSEEMSTVAIAVNMLDSSSYKKFHDAMMKSNAHGKADAIKVAKEVGISGEKLEALLESSKEKIAAVIKANRELGSSIGINGTPGFVIGEELIPGALELGALKEKIAAVRKK